MPIISSIGVSADLLPWPKKRTILEIRGEKNAVPRVISCSIRRDQRRAKVADSRGSDLPCADRAWSSMISHVEQRSSRRESRWWFFFLARVVGFPIKYHSHQIMSNNKPHSKRIFNEKEAFENQDWALLNLISMILAGTTIVVAISIIPLTNVNKRRLTEGQTKLLLNPNKWC